MSLYQRNYSANSVASKTAAGSSLSHWMSHGFAFLQIKNISGVAQKNNRPKGQDIQFKAKFLLMIAWNPLGFHLLTGLPKDRTFNTAYSRDNTLMSLPPFRSQVDG
jgi:hypothetical protein